ncbi:MAG: DUF3667 domain-containing protein [Burkholderiales bacterium]|nr:DUF3667 domain-containing protein [Burkholderiales bacterium]
MNSPVPAPVNVCLNCGAKTAGNFCSECGQETAREPQSLADAVRALATQHLTRKGLIWQTLVKLFFTPGALTVEYTLGRRVRYLRPWRLYLLASVFVFALVQFFSLNLSFRLYGEQGVHLLRSTRVSSTDDSRNRGMGVAPVQLILDKVNTTAVQRFKALSPEDRFSFLRARRTQYVSYFVLFLVPALALTLGFFYRNRRRRYVEHLVFGLHCQSYLLFMLLVEAKLPTILANGLSYWMIVYFTLALKRVYGGSWTETICRGAAILIFYFGIISIANLALVLTLISF